MALKFNPFTGTFDNDTDNTVVLDGRYVNVTGDTMTGTLSFTSSGGPNVLINTSAGNGISIRGTGSSTVGKLRIVSNTNGWADTQTHAYFQVDTESASHNLIFLSGDYGADSQFTRLLFDSNASQFSDIFYTSVPAPTAILEAITGTASKVPFKVMGYTSQSANLTEWQDVSTNKLALVNKDGSISGAGYLRVGSTSAPSNTTAGDITGTRLSLGNTSFSTTVAALVATGTMTQTSGTNFFSNFINTMSPASNSSAEFRALQFQNLPSATTGVTIATIRGGYFENRVIQDGTITTLSGVSGIAMVASSASASTVAATTVQAFEARVWARPSGTTTSTITTGIGYDTADLASNAGLTITTLAGFRMQNPSSANTITTLIGLDVAALTRGSTNIGVRIAAPSGGATANYALQLSDTGGTAAGGITFGTDVQLYRSAANTLKLDDNFAFDGESARDITQARNTTTTGSNLTIQAGGALSGGTDLNGGDLLLSGGIGVGSGSSNVRFYTAPSGSGGGTTDRSPAERGRFTGAPNGVFLIGVTSAQGGITTNDGINLGGAVARSIHLTNATAGNNGNNLGIKAGAANNTGSTDKNGGTLILASGQSTGTGTAAVKIQTPTTATSTSATQNTLTDRIIVTTPKALTDGSATNLVSCTIASGSAIGGNIRYTIEVTDGTDYQSESGYVYFTAVNKAGTVTATITEHNSGQSVSAGTLTTTWAISAASPTVISLNADTSLSPSTGYPRITYVVENYGQQAIAIQ